MPSSVNDAKSKNKIDSSQNQEQEIELYIGIFFDGTNNNKCQTMLGKLFRRQKILEEIVKSANNGELSDEQIMILLHTEPKPVIKEIDLSSIGPGLGYNRQMRGFQANISPNELTKNYSPTMWRKGKRKNGSEGILSKSQIDQLYFGYENSGEYTNFIEKHIKTTLEFSPQSHVLSSVAENPLENSVLKIAADDFINETETFKDMKEAEGAFAQNATYTNVAILESLYKLDSESETDRHFSIYVEGSGADMVILPGLNKTYRRKADKLAYITKYMAKVFSSSLSHNEGLDILESLFECGVDWLTPEVLPKVLERIDDIAGLGFGVGPTGVIEKSRKAAELIKKIIYEFPNQKINLHFDIFGFSRGATTARMLNYAIDACKVNEKKDFGRIKEEDTKLISGYPRFVKINHNIISKEVRLLGIFDTVSSIGVYRNGKILNKFLANKIKNHSKLFKNRDKEPYHDRNVDDFGLYATDQAKDVFHICALDEVRQNFALVDIQSSVDSMNGLELFIPGCHTDIGGGTSIGREDAKIVNLNSYKGVRNYFCVGKSTSYNSMIYKPVSAENFQKAGWLDNSQKIGDKTISGRPGKNGLADSDDTVYTDNANNWHTRNNIVMYRYVKAGYSNIALSLMHKKGKKLFVPIPICYSIPDDLKDYYSDLERRINEKGRVFANPSKASYYSLRNQYLHFSANDQLVSPADNLLVNPPAYALASVISSSTDKTIFGSSLKEVSRDLPAANKAPQVDDSFVRLASRIIYHGIERKENSLRNEVPEVAYMFDYNEDGFDVQCEKLMAKVREKLQKEKKHIEKDIENIANKAEAYNVQMTEKQNERQSVYLFNMRMECERQMKQKDVEREDIINILNDFPNT